MENQIAENYLNNVKKLFLEYKRLGEGAIVQIKDTHINYSEDENSNSIAIIVKHLTGNMVSRWTNFLTSDGEKDWRNRDSEFEGIIENKNQLIELWNRGWNCLFDAINPLTIEDLNKTVYIRNEPHNVIEALNRQLTHYAYHIGQIIYISKAMASNDWKSLSIPKRKIEKT